MTHPTHVSIAEQHHLGLIISQAWKAIKTTHDQYNFDEWSLSLCAWVGDDDLCEEIEFLIQLSWSKPNEH